MRPGDGQHDDAGGGGGHRRRAILVVLLLAAIGISAAVGLREAGGGSATGRPQHGIAAIELAPAEVGIGLYPGSRVTVSSLALNASPQPVHIRRVRVDVRRARGGWAPSRPRCRVPQLTFVPQDNHGRGWTVPAAGEDRSGALRLRFPRALRMGLLADDRCQGSRFAVFLTAE